MVHSIIGPSSAKTILSCRPSLLVPPAAGGDGDNTYTSQGDAAHQLIETCGLARFLGEGDSSGNPRDHVGEHINGVEVDVDMANDADIFLREVQRIKTTHPTAEIFFERRIVHSVVGEFGGTMDCLILTDDQLWVLDFKFGMGQTVNVEDNPQLLCYAILAMDAVGKRDRVNLTVVQTRKPHPDGLVRSWSPDYSDIDEFANTLMLCIQQYRERKARQDSGEKVYLTLIDEYNPTEDNCRFCPGKANCPALRAMHESYTMQTKFDPKYVARVLETEFLVRKHIDAVKIQAEAEMADGNEVPGFKRITKYGNRRWNAEMLKADAGQFTADLIGCCLPGTQVLAPSGKLLSPAQLEKKGVERSLFEHLVERPITGVKVVPVGDFGDDLDSQAALDDALAALS